MLFLVALPAAGAAIGAIKGRKAHGTMKDARDLAADRAALYQRVVGYFDDQRPKTVSQLASYGAMRLDVYDSDLRRLQNALQHIGGVRSSELAEIDIDLAVQIDALDLTSIDFAAIDAVKAALAAAGMGATTYLATIGAVGIFATASTGTPIAVLSGAAAWNATLAWLGGGALAAGGMGAGFGAVVLGGIVLGPALAVGGLLLAAKATERMEEAKAFASKVDVAVEELRTATRAAQVIGNRAAGYTEVAGQLRAVLTPLIDEVCSIAASGRGFAELSAPERHRLHLAFELAVTLKLILDTPLVTAGGKPAPAPEKALRDARDAAKAWSR